MSVDVFLGMWWWYALRRRDAAGGRLYMWDARERSARLAALRRCRNRLYNWGRDRGDDPPSAFRGDAAGRRLYMRGWLPWVSWVRVEGGDGVDMWWEKIEPRGAYASRGSFKWRLPTLPRCWRSTIGAGGLNFSVRDGKRWGPAAIAA